MKTGVVAVCGGVACCCDDADFDIVTEEVWCLLVDKTEQGDGWWGKCTYHAWDDGV